MTAQTDERSRTKHGAIITRERFTFWTGSKTHSLPQHFDGLIIGGKIGATPRHNPSTHKSYISVIDLTDGREMLQIPSMPLYQLSAMLDMFYPLWLIALEKKRAREDEVQLTLAHNTVSEYRSAVDTIIHTVQVLNTPQEASHV